MATKWCKQVKVNEPAGEQWSRCSGGFCPHIDHPGLGKDLAQGLFGEFEVWGPLLRHPQQNSIVVIMT